MVVRDIEREHVPLCRQYGLGILPWSPLAGGFLSGKSQKEQAPPTGGRLEVKKERFSDLATAKNWRALDALRAVAEEKETTVPAVALAWLIAKPAVSSVIFGARSLEQLDANLATVDVALTADEVRRLDDASAFDPGYLYKVIAGVQQRW